MFYENEDYKRATSWPPVIGYYRKKGDEIARKNYGLKDRDEVDSFRHTWASADMTYKDGELASRLGGDANEFFNTNNNPNARNMDDWNNHTGREIAKYAKENNIPREKLPDLVHDKFKAGELITKPHNDGRIYDRNTFKMKPFESSVRIKKEKPLSVEDVSKMSNREFREREDEIDELVKSNKLYYENPFKASKLLNSTKSWFKR